MNKAKLAVLTLFTSSLAGCYGPRHWEMVQAKRSSELADDYMNIQRFKQRDIAFNVDLDKAKSEPIAYRKDKNGKPIMMLFFVVNGTDSTMTAEYILNDTPKHAGPYILSKISTNQATGNNFEIMQQGFNAITSKKNHLTPAQQ